MGLPCADDTGGVRIDPTTGSPACPTFAIVCTSSACTPNTYGDRDLANFNDIYRPMRVVFGCSPVTSEICRLQPENVTITYQREANLNNLGFNEPNGFPMTITVSITGMTHQFYFLDGLVRFFGGGIKSTPGIPQYTTTLTGEDMCSDVDNRPCGF